MALLHGAVHAPIRGDPIFHDAGERARVTLQYVLSGTFISSPNLFLNMLGP